MSVDSKNQFDRDALLRRVAKAMGIDPDLDAGAIVEELDGVLAPLNPGALAPDLIESVERLRRSLAPPSVDAMGLATLSDRFGSALGQKSERHGQRCSLWLGDITHLATDAIVNAANSALLGCRIPHHRCIDNAIHTASGPRLRDACAELMMQQEYEEPIGTAKLTAAFALPCKFVLHTVGPCLRVGTEPTAGDHESLASCYRACLDLAATEPAIRTLAFCAVSTGLFAFPGGAAAETALETVFDWLDVHPNRFDRIVFNTFTRADERFYVEALI